MVKFTEFHVSDFAITDTSNGVVLAFKYDSGATAYDEYIFVYKTEKCYLIVYSLENSFKFHYYTSKGKYIKCVNCAALCIEVFDGHVVALFKNAIKLYDMNDNLKIVFSSDLDNIESVMAYGDKLYALLSGRIVEIRIRTRATPAQLMVRNASIAATVIENVKGNNWICIKYKKYTVDEYWRLLLPNTCVGWVKYLDDETCVYKNIDQDLIMIESDEDGKLHKLNTSLTDASIKKIYHVEYSANFCGLDFSD